MASRKDMPAIAFIDMHGEVDLRTLPVGTRIVTTGITKFRHYVKENHTRYVKEKIAHGTDLAHVGRATTPSQKTSTSRRAQAVESASSTSPSTPSADKKEKDRVQS